MNSFYKNFSTKVNDFKKEPRAFCFEICVRMINDAKIENQEWYLNNKTIEAILLLLFCWNYAYPKTKKLTKKELVKVISRNIHLLYKLEKLNIMTFQSTDEKMIRIIFEDFKTFCGQTGATKALSLLNTKLFVMWDTKIRKKFQKEFSGIGNGNSGANYINFLNAVKKIIESNKLINNNFTVENIAKKIDEFHYSQIALKIK